MIYEIDYNTTINGLIQYGGLFIDRVLKIKNLPTQIQRTIVCKTVSKVYFYST